MAKIHEDVFMWKTIKEVVPHLTDEQQEEIYKQLENKTWRIVDIEKLAREVE